MALGGGGVSALFWVPPVTPGDFAAWLEPGVLDDGGGGGGGGMSIGGTVVGGTPGSVLFIGAGSTLAQDNAAFFWDDTNKHFEVKGDIQLKGSASGTVTVTPQAAAGTWTFSLPTNPGTNNYVLQTDGTGITSWVAQSGGGMSIGGAVTGGTPGSILFVGAGPVLAQDNANFFWDDTNHILKLAAPGNIEIYNVIGANFERGIVKWNSNILDVGVTTADAGGSGVLRDVRYWSAGVPGLYRIPNASGDNWFEGGAGNFTVTGSSNFGTGPGCLVSLTTGINNMAIGTSAATRLTGGSQNTAIGTEALFSCLTGSRNVALGLDALGTLDSNDNVGVGFFAGFSISTGVQNLALGTSALRHVTSGDNNCAVGVGALQELTASSQQNVGVGTGAFQPMTSGQFNIAIGCQAGISWLTGSNNTLVGTQAGLSIVGGSNNTLIGSWEGGPGLTINKVIAITDGTLLSAPFYNIRGVDYNYTLPNVWSFQYDLTANGLHVYNTTDSLAPPTNYERGCLDWNITANIFTIGTQAGGTGVARNVEFIVGGVNKLDYGVTNAGLWTFAQATMFATSVALTNGAAASAGTLNNAPAAGDPTKWIPINDNGTTRYIPAW